MLKTYTDNLSAAITELATTDALDTPDTITLLMQTDEIREAMKQYCEHSGKLCGTADYDQTRAMLAIHGKTTTLKILKTQRKQVSMEWIWLNSEGLQALAQHQPHEFFIYICQKLLINQTINNTGNRFEESVKSFASIQKFNKSLLNPINELMRRLLGMSCQSNCDSLLRKFQKRNLSAIVGNLTNLLQFQTDLQTAITSIVEGKKKRKHCKEGASLYRSMKMIAALSALELSIGHEFNDFDLIEGKSADTVKNILGGGRKTPKAKKQKAPKFQSQSIQKTGTFKLKLGGSNAK